MNLFKANKSYPAWRFCLMFAKYKVNLSWPYWACLTVVIEDLNAATVC